MIQTARAAGLTIVATPTPEDYGVDLTFILQNTEGNAGTWNLPLLIEDIPDFVEAISETLGAVYEQHGCKNEPDEEEIHTCNGLGEQILKEMK
jgi:hypothetical protein